MPGELSGPPGQTICFVSLTPLEASCVTRDPCILGRLAHD